MRTRRESSRSRSAALLAALAACGVLACAPAATAGPFADELGRCLVQNSSTKDKTDLVRWIFANAALHPDVASIAKIGSDEREYADRTIAALFERLLTDACRKQTQEALKYEGDSAMEKSFEVLGQVAMQELMANPIVAAAFTEFVKYLDEAKIRALKPR